jgi:hypothetical protein
MRLRNALNPPHLDPDFVTALADIASQLDGCDPVIQDCASLVERFNASAGTSLELGDFHFSGAVDAETFVRTHLTPSPRKVADITYEELLELVTRVFTADGEDYELDYWLAVIEANVPDPNVVNLIYWPEQYFGPDTEVPDLTPRKILEIALSAKPRRVLITPPPSGGPAN